MDAYESAAGQILAQIRATYVPTHNYIEVSPAEFRHLNLRFYERTLSSLAKAGFRHLADFEDTTLTSVPGSILPRIMIRSMLSSDGTIMAAAYDPKVKLIWRILLVLLRKKLKPVIDFETEYSDGTYVVTSNGEMASSIKIPPMVIAEYLPAGTPVRDVLARHMQCLEAVEAVNPSAVRRSFSTREDVVLAQNRMNAIKAAYREELGGVTLEELQATFGKQSDLSRKIHEKMTVTRGGVSSPARRAG